MSTYLFIRPLSLKLNYVRSSYKNQFSPKNLHIGSQKPKKGFHIIYHLFCSAEKLPKCWKRKPNPIKVTTVISHYEFNPWILNNTIAKKYRKVQWWTQTTKNKTILMKKTVKFLLIKITITIWKNLMPVSKK